MSLPTKVMSDETGVSVNEKNFRGVISSFLYLIASHPDIMFFICMHARIKANMKESPMKVVKRIFSYLIWYSKIRIMISDM